VLPGVVKWVPLSVSTVCTLCSDTTSHSYEFICKAWTKEPARFTLNPIHQMPGLNI
jgi:hypothetical protein